jgi:hypothetical protein
MAARGLCAPSFNDPLPSLLIELDNLPALGLRFRLRKQAIELFLEPVLGEQAEGIPDGALRIGIRSGLHQLANLIGDLVGDFDRGAHAASSHIESSRSVTVRRGVDFGQSRSL